MAFTASAHALEWKRGWETQSQDTLAYQDTPRPVSLGDAEKLRDGVDSLESIQRAIQAWKQVAAAQPDDPAPWTELASLYLLEGAAYQTGRATRLRAYKDALTASERAMACNPQFLRRVSSGESPWEAASALKLEEAGALHFWVTGIFYIFRDCLGPWSRIRNVRWMKAAHAMLDRLDAVDPTWGGSVSTFSRGIYYLAMPKFQGGDRKKARACFDRAVAAAPNRTVARWGRGKYFHAAMGNEEAARADLEHVANQPIEELEGNRAWNRYIRRDAESLLAAKAR